MSIAVFLMVYELCAYARDVLFTCFCVTSIHHGTNHPPTHSFPPGVLVLDLFFDRLHSSLLAHVQGPMPADCAIIANQCIPQL